MKLHALAVLYGRFAAALGTLVLVTLPVAHLLPVPGWAYLYALPVLAVAYAVFRTASYRPPTLEELYLEVGKRESRNRQQAEDEAARRQASRAPRGRLHHDPPPSHCDHRAGHCDCSGPVRAPPPLSAGSRGVAST